MSKSRVVEDNILVFDVEGADSIERQEDRVRFQLTTSSFALVISDVLLINMWTRDVGRFEASGYGMFKSIFEANFKFFGNQ